MAPAPVNAQPIIDTGPASAASEAGSRKMPEPIMLPTTSAVAIQRPIERLSLRCGAAGAGSAEADPLVLMGPPFSGEPCGSPVRLMDRSFRRSLAPAIGPHHA